MYTYYFQSVTTRAGQRFILTAAKSHASGVQPTDRSQRYSEDQLRNLVAAGYRVVIDPTPAAQQNLERLLNADEDRSPATLKLARGFRAIYPATMFTIPEYGDYAGISEYILKEDTTAQNGFKADQQDAAFDKQSNRLSFSRALCGEDIVADENPEFEIYRQDTPGGDFKQTTKVTADDFEITEHTVRKYQLRTPSAGPLPPQAPLAPSEKVDEFGVSDVGSRIDFFTGVRGPTPWEPADGYASSKPEPLPPPGTMLLPPTHDKPFESEIPENARLVSSSYDLDGRSLGQIIKDFFNALFK